MDSTRIHGIFLFLHDGRGTPLHLASRTALLLSSLRGYVPIWERLTQVYELITVCLWLHGLPVPSLVSVPETIAVTISLLCSFLVLGYADEAAFAMEVAIAMQFEQVLPCTLRKQSITVGRS